MTPHTTSEHPTVAARLAEWAVNLEPTAEDLALADRSVLDTVAVALAAATHSARELADVLAEVSGPSAGEAARWAMLAHVIDFDDLHLPSTTHISTICVPVALALAPHDPALAARSYLAGAGIMARLGIALGWSHYTAGWHATTTTGAPAAAVVAGLALGLDSERIATAIALAIPAAGGVQRAFGTDAKSIQVGMAAAAGVRAAQLAAAGATADTRVLEPWMRLVGGDPSHPLMEDPSGDGTVPGGLAIKLYPACYALQRPIGALREALGARLDPAGITAIRVTTPRGTVTPLIHHKPRTGLQGKFSLEYAAATALLDRHSGFAAFEDDAVNRPEAMRLVDLTQTTLTDSDGEGLLDGTVEVEIGLADGSVRRGALDFPPGSPGKPPTREEMNAKVLDCLDRGRITGVAVAAINWASGAALLTNHLGGRIA